MTARRSYIKTSARGRGCGYSLFQLLEKRSYIKTSARGRGCGYSLFQLLEMLLCCKCQKYSQFKDLTYLLAFLLLLFPSIQFFFNFFATWPTLQ
jgi:hypothetical protein